MRQSSRQNVNWLCRVALTICCLHFSAAASWTAEQLIDEAVIRKWEAYERFARSLQGTARITTVISGSNAAREQRNQIVWKQNQNCISSYRILEGKPTEQIRIANPQYHADLKRSLSNPGEVVLEHFYESTELPTRGDTVFEQDLPTISPHFYVAQRIPFSRILLDPHFKILKVSKRSENDHEMVRMDYQAVREKSGIRHEYSGWVDLDPSRSWCIVRSKEERKVTRKNGVRPKNNVLEVEREMIDHPSGFPLMKSCTAHLIQHIFDKDGKGETIDSRTRIDYKWEVNDHVPDSEFTLTAYGLPEPGGEPVKKSIPLFVWLLVAAGICAVLALGFRYLARRRARSEPAR